MSNHCLNCGYTGDMVLLSSIDRKICPECRTYNLWRLKPNQESVLCEGKKGERVLPKTDNKTES